MSPKNPSIAEMESKQRKDNIGRSAEPTPAATSIVRDIPEYWEHSNSYHAPDPEPYLKRPCGRTSGIHVSWLHYCSLCFVICCMGFVIMLWTAVALGNTSTAFIGSPTKNAAPIVYEIPRLHVAQEHVPISKGLPNGDMVVANACAVTVITTFTVEQKSISTIFKFETAISRTSSPLATPTSSSKQPDVSQFSIDAEVAAFKESESANESSPTSEDRRTTITVTQAPTMLPIKPSTRYIGDLVGI